MLVDGLVHPVFRLFVATVVEVAVGLHEIDVLVDHVPDLFHARTVEAGVAEHLRCPAALGHGEEVKGIAEIGGSHLTTVDIIAVALVDDDAVRNLHDTAFDALQLVACACYLNEQEEVDHRVTGCLALPYSNSLDEDLVEARSLAEDDGLTSLTGHATQRTC